MPRIDPAYLERQLKRWMRPDAHLFVRPDWRNFVRPGFEDEHPFKRYEHKYRPDQARVPPGSRDGGQWTDEGGSGGGSQGGGNDPRVLSDASPDPIQPGAQYAQNGPRRPISSGVIILSMANGTSRRLGNRLVLPLSKPRLRTPSAASRNSTRAGTRGLTLITASKAS